MKLSYKIFSVFLIANLATTVFVSAEEMASEPSSGLVETANKEVTKLLSKKSKNKVWLKLKNSLTDEKQAKIVNQIVTSKASDAQKIVLLEALIQAKTEIEKIPDDGFSE